MGEVEQMRLAESSGREVAPGPPVDDVVEKALVRDVETAWKNLTGYLARRSGKIQG